MNSIGWKQKAHDIHLSKISNFISVKDILFIKRLFSYFNLSVYVVYWLIVSKFENIQDFEISQTGQIGIFFFYFQIAFKFDCVNLYEMFQMISYKVSMIIRL